MPRGRSSIALRCHPNEAKAFEAAAIAVRQGHGQKILAWPDNDRKSPKLIEPLMNPTIRNRTVCLDHHGRLGRRYRPFVGRQRADVGALGGTLRIGSELGDGRIEIASAVESHDAEPSPVSPALPVHQLRPPTLPPLAP